MGIFFNWIKEGELMTLSTPTAKTSPQSIKENKHETTKIHLLFNLFYFNLGIDKLCNPTK
jgi:hypothetical protein